MITRISNPKEWMEIKNQLRTTNIGFVPTMGALHDGHFSLITKSKGENDKTIASIFVNPTQFDNKDDLEKYPRLVEQDIEQLKRAGCDYVFLPEMQQLYADDYRFRVTETSESQILCGTSRPGHFDGVLTVVLRLLNIIQPKRAYFGEKDFQQLRLVQGMAKAFFMPVEVIGCPIVRESDGLAMSSRNLRLTEEQRKIAPLFYKTLKRKLPLHEIRHSLKVMGFEVDYVEERWGRRLGAVKLGDIRLIDNVALES